MTSIKHNSLSIIIIYVKILFIKLINVLSRVFGFIRVYDIHKNKDITMFFYALKYFLKLKLPVKIDFSCPVLGICAYDNGRYVRYICYNKKLSKVGNKRCRISSINYDSIKKIEIIEYDDDEKEFITDVTAAKNDFNDVNFYTNEYDMIKFHYLYTGESLLNTNDTKCKKPKIILLTREFFDNDLLEVITLYEEIYVNDKSNNDTGNNVKNNIK